MKRSPMQQGLRRGGNFCSRVSAVLVDTNLTPRWVEQLKDAGYQAAHWSLSWPATSIFPRSLPTPGIADRVWCCFGVSR